MFVRVQELWHASNCVLLHIYNMYVCVCCRVFINKLPRKLFGLRYNVAASLWRRTVWVYQCSGLPTAELFSYLDLAGTAYVCGYVCTSCAYGDVLK